VAREQKLEKSLKTAMFRLIPSAGYQGYQLDIMSCHSLVKIVFLFKLAQVQMI